MKMPMLSLAFLALLSGLVVHGTDAQDSGGPPPASSPAGSTFTDPLLDSGPDPWVVYWKGFYYYSNTTGRNLQLRKTADITNLRQAKSKIVWTPEPGQPWSQELWAPELHRWGNKWYLYFTADAGKNESHRIYVVENPSEDPTEGTWTLKGKVADASDGWAIDPTEFEWHGQHYLAWSGWKGANDGEQDLYLAHMSNPWTIDSPRTLISQPTYPWEEHGDLPGRHVNVNEGPEFLAHGDQAFIVFSASACWTDFYELGVLKAAAGGDLLNPATWTKVPHPFFTTDAASQAFSPGHNGFFQSPDGKENWIIYHANPGPNQGCENLRSPRIQRFTWNPDGTPHFGRPVALGEPVRKPSE